MDQETKRKYELVFLLSPELEAAELKSFEKEVEEKIKTLEGEVHQKEEAQKRALAYPVKKFESGYFWAIIFSIDPNKVNDFLSEFKHKKEVLRYLNTVYDEEAYNALTKTKPKKGIAKKEKLTPKLKVEKKAKPSTTKTKKEKKEKKEKIKIEEIDKKLDEILKE